MIFSVEKVELQRRPLLM